MPRTLTRPRRPVAKSARVTAPQSRFVREKDFQAAVMALAKLCGWLAFHVFDSRRSAPGFPDTVLVRGERLIFAELKLEKKYPSPAQREWLTALQGVPGIEVYLWRPSDWGAIEIALKIDGGYTGLPVMNASKLVRGMR